jgi:hypothetical protein
VKLISDDHTFIYYFYDRFDGKSEGISVGRSTGIVGFISGTPAKKQQHPIEFLKFDPSPLRVPTRRVDYPPIIRSVVPQIEREHPEINGLLDGSISFETALNSCAND